MDRERGPGLRDAAQADHAFACELRAVAANEDLLAGIRLHERAVRALVDERELVAARLDARVHARDQIALDDDVVLLGAAQGRALAPLADGDLAALIAQAQPLRTRAGLSAVPDCRQHARRLVGLPKHLEQHDLVGPAADRRDVDLTRDRLPLGRQVLDRRQRRDDLLRLGLARHPIGRVHGRAENVTVLLHDGAVMATDPNRDVAVVVRELVVGRDLLLHPARGVHRIVGGRERRHDLVTHRLDDRAAVPLRGGTHHLDAGRHHLTGELVAHRLVDPRGSDYVGKDDGEFDVRAHAT